MHLTGVCLPGCMYLGACIWVQICTADVQAGRPSWSGGGAGARGSVLHRGGQGRSGKVQPARPCTPGPERAAPPCCFVWGVEGCYPGALLLRRWCAWGSRSCGGL